MIPNLSIKGQFIERVDKFTYLGSCITLEGSIAEELSSLIQKARLDFSNLHQLWRRNGIKLSTKGRVWLVALRSVLLYGLETWPLKAEDIRTLSVFDHRCLRSIGQIWWEHRISNTEVRRRVSRPKNMSIIEQLPHHRLRWLGHLLRMSDDRLIRVSNVGWAGWGPRDPSHLWLETLSDMASSRSQWRSCTFSLALSS